MPPAVAGRRVRLFSVIDPANATPEIHDWTGPWDPAVHPDPIPNNEGWREQYIAGSQAASADLSISPSDIVVGGTTAGCAGPICLAATVRNSVGSASSSTFRVDFFDGDPRTVPSLEAARVGSVTLGPIPGGGSATAQISRAAAGDAPLWVMVMPLGAWDANLANNLVAAATAAPGVVTAPTVVGPPDPGRIVTCDQGTWSGSPAGFTYQWLRDEAPIAGQTQAFLTVQAGDSGHLLQCRVTASNANGPTSATSVGVVVTAPLPGAPVNTAAPTITPLPVLGVTPNL